MDRPGWASGDVDLAQPSAARVYDYYLGGSHNFAVDRRMARQAIELWRPDSPADVDDHPERFTGYAAVGRRE